MCIIPFKSPALFVFLASNIVRAQVKATEQKIQSSEQVWKKRPYFSRCCNAMTVPSSSYSVFYHFQDEILWPGPHRWRMIMKHWIRLTNSKLLNCLTSREKTAFFKTPTYLCRKHRAQKTWCCHISHFIHQAEKNPKSSFKSRTVEDLRIHTSIFLFSLLLLLHQPNLACIKNGKEN